MPSLERITTENVRAFKTVRLWALSESPSAFGSTYAREAGFLESEWVTRAAKMNGETRIGYLAMEDGVACGIAAGFLDERDPTRAQLVSMWVAPSFRRTGVGGLLVDAIKSWARRIGVGTLQLMVTSSNQVARQFYERNGFSMTGRTEPYPNDASLLEHEMSVSVSGDDTDVRNKRE